MRTIEIFYEPAPFFALGFVLWAIGQPVGTLLLVCSVAYALSYAAAYWLGDNQVMDLLDDIIRHRNLKKVFVQNAAPQDAEGYEYRGQRPATAAEAEALAERMLAGDSRQPASVS